MMRSQAINSSPCDVCATKTAGLPPPSTISMRAALAFQRQSMRPPAIASVIASRLPCLARANSLLRLTTITRLLAASGGERLNV